MSKNILEFNNNEFGFNMALYDLCSKSKIISVDAINNIYM